ncbi:uncharacterized protein LOC104428097 isoform X2 [Eucalyptus grandis]|uniref:uncharacterized protein LOC104428097 isoform X2 n=1 Tax=Eucalyptus grandis TaxID=71139 RepID=UPI00192EAB68|nr:uncharacterized protein LOC104428097 isoform X2 [Eucalyptus grandis]
MSRLLPSLEDVTILGKLKGLQFLSFYRSAITRLPKEIGELIELRFLDLTGCTKLKIIEPRVLGRLVNLEELYMEYSFDRWEAEDEVMQSNASLAELKNMKKLSTLYIAIPHSAYLPRDLPFHKLNKHKIQIGGVWDWSGKNTESKILKLKLHSSNLLLEEWVSKCLQKTQDLHLDGLQDGIDSIHDLCVEGFEALKHLHVQNSPSFQYVVHCTENVQCTAFTRLESLFLENLNNLEKICRGCLALESFSKLKIVKVDNCGVIKHLFPLSMTRILLQLEEIKISRCHLMQQIVADAEADEEGDEIDDVPQVKSCNLRRLTLQNLPKMTNFCKTADHSVDFFDGQQITKLQSLEAITIERCQLIREVFDLEGLTANGEVEILSQLRELILSDLPSLGWIWNKNPRKMLCFQNLRALKVQNCDNLRFLFSSSMAKALGQIKEIEIVNCKLMEEIIDVQEEELEEATTTDALEFPLLTSLSLEELPNLMTFSYGMWCIRCPSLARLTISRCAKMMTFSSFEGRQQSMATDTSLQQAFGCIHTVSSLPSFFNEKLAFPKLEELHVEGVQHKDIWNDKILVESFHRLKVLKVKQCHNLMNVIPSFMWRRLLHCVESLTVEKCPRLRNLFTMSMAKSLGQLQYLGLGSCGEIEYIVAKEEEKLEEATDKIIIPQLVTLYLHNMPKLRSFYEGKHISEWPSLKDFTVEDCKAVKVILGDVSCRKLEGSIPTHQPLLLVEKVEFPALESMKILHMENMEKIWLDDLGSNAFGKLKTLVVEHCEKLLSIFSSYNMLTRFQNLEKITVTDCGSLEVAFQVQEFEFSEACSTNSFQLGEIVLTQLPKMKHVWNGLPQGGLTFGCLQRMEVVKCESLKSLFPTSVAKNMTQFKELLVRDCGVEEIIAEKDRVGMSASDLFFPQLTDLRLLELPKLGSFYRNSHTSAWPLLKKLRVRHCSKMRSFLFACEFQGCQGTTTSKNQSALFSFEKVISHLEGLTLMMEDVMMMMPQHYVFHNLKELALACYHDENVAFLSNFLLHRFPNLEELDVICSSFEEIFPEDSSRTWGSDSMWRTN